MIDLKEKLDQRLKDLERAHSTATSDPSAKEDITDVGDMEIESDGESQDSQDGITREQPRVASGSAAPPPPPGMLEGPPLLSYPHQHQLQQQQREYRSGPPPPANFQHHLEQQHYARRPLPPPRNFAMGQNRPIRMSRTMFEHRGPCPPPHPRSPRVQSRPPGVMRPPYKGEPPSQPPEAHISRGPVLYNNNSKPSPQQEFRNTPPSKPPHESESEDATKLSLEERLKDLMANKKFGNTVLKDDMLSEDKPYSPEAVVSNNIAVEEVDNDDDKESLPTPVSEDSPTGEVTPQPNMDNPILKALYTSQASPEDKPARSLVPDYEDNEDELSTTDLKNILHQVNLEEGGKKNAEDNNGRHESPPTTGTSSSSGPGTKLPAPPITITPTLTNLLDEIFPQLSKSLIDRKRKQSETISEDVTNKVPRLLTDPPPSQQTPPPPQQTPPRPQFAPQSPNMIGPPRPPFLRGDGRPHPSPPVAPRPFPPPPPSNRQIPPSAGPTESMMHPQVYNRPPRPDRHMMDSRFRGPPPNFPPVRGMMRPYQEPGHFRPIPAGYRPRPRYV